MKLSTKEQQESYENGKICYIFKEKFEKKYLKNKKYCKFRDHYYYKGEYKGTAHIIHIIIRNNKKSIVKCKYTHKKKLSDPIPGYEVSLTRFSHDPNKVIFNFSSYVLTKDKKRLLCKGLKFCIPPKKIEYADFLTQFELLYRDTIMFKMKSENRDFLKKKFKDICLSTICLESI